MVGANNMLRGTTTFFLLSASSSSRPLLPTIFNALPNFGIATATPRRSPSLSQPLTPSSFSISLLNNGRTRRRGLFSQCFCSDSTTTTSSSNVNHSKEDDDSSASASRSEDSSSADKQTPEIKDAANTLDIRVGKILRCWKHEEADSLYVEEVDIGEPQPRIICSGLVNYVPIQHLQDRHVIVLANLKPRNMRGVKSFGMLMAASDESHQNVELLLPPEGSTPGERVWFGLDDEKDNLPEAATPNQVQKKKIWELVQPHLRTNDSCVAMLGSHYMRTPAGVVVSSSLANARVS